MSVTIRFREIGILTVPTTNQSLDRDVVLLELVLQEVPQPEVPLRSHAVTPRLGAREFGLLVDLAHMGDVVGSFPKSRVLKKCVSRPPVGTVFMRTRLVVFPTLNTNVMVVPQMLSQVILALEAVGPTVPPAVRTWEALDIGAMFVLVPCKDIEPGECLRAVLLRAEE